MEYSNRHTTREFSFTIFRRICRIPVVVYQTGILQIATIAKIYFFEPWMMKAMPVWAGLVKKTRLIYLKMHARRDLKYWSSRKSEILSGSDDTSDIAELGFDENDQKLFEERSRTTNPLVLAKIDQNGSFLSVFGKIDGVRCVDEAGFRSRTRFFQDLVAIDRKVGIRKNYNGCIFSFIRETEALHALRKAGCNVPPVLDIDFENCSLTVAYIPKTVLREQAGPGRVILRDGNGDRKLQSGRLPQGTPALKKIDAGERHIQENASREFIEKLFDQIVKIHSAGFILNKCTFDDVIVAKKTGNPYLIDFESSVNVQGMGQRAFRQLRDDDIETFNRYFGKDNLTYRRLREKITNREYPPPETWYAPVSISSGLRIGALWNIGAGWGRWHFILKKNLPDPTGKRVLDLGANNGFNGLQILKRGAREVVGIEIDPVTVRQGDFLKSAMEWSDNRKYNFRYILSDMKELKSMDLGRFDLVLALCSLYYLEDDEIPGLIRHISTITDCFVVQCNTERDIGRENPHTYEKSSVEYLKSALEENGFPRVKVVAPKRYARPLLIAKK